MSKISTKLFSVICLLLTVLMFPAQGAAAQKQIKLRLGHEMPETHVYHLGAQKFADLLAQKTNNAITVQIFPNGTLGKQAQLLDGLAMGTIDLALTNTVTLEKYNPQVSVLALPYLFRDWGHVYKVADGEIGKELNAGLEKKGITVLAFHQIGVIIFSSIKPVNGPGDVKGLKLRVQPGPSWVEVGKVLDSVVTPTAYGEVYTALQLGTIDVQSQSISNVLNSKHYEVAKYIVLNNISYFLEPLSMSMMVYDRMSPAHKKALKEAAHESAVWQRKAAGEMEDADLKTLQEKYGVVVTKPNLDEWRAVVSPIHQKLTHLAGTIQRINEVK